MDYHRGKKMQFGLAAFYASLLRNKLSAPNWPKPDSWIYKSYKDHIVGITHGDTLERMIM